MYKKSPCLILLLLCLVSCTIDTTSAPHNPFVGVWECVEEEDPYGVFARGFFYDFDESGIFYTVIGGYGSATGTFVSNTSDLYLGIGPAQLHWNTEFDTSSTVRLSMTSGYALLRKSSKTDAYKYQ